MKTLDCQACGKTFDVNSMYSVDACSVECQEKIGEVPTINVHDLGVAGGYTLEGELVKLQAKHADLEQAAQAMAEALEHIEKHPDWYKIYGYHHFTFDSALVSYRKLKGDAK